MSLVNLRRVDFTEVVGCKMDINGVDGWCHHIADVREKIDQWLKAALSVKRS
jgi:hypothetical protein